MELWFTQTIRSPEIIAVLLTAALAAIGRLLQPATRLVWGTSHGFTFLVPQPPNAPILIATGTVFIQNIGRKTAEGIEIVLNFKPHHFQIWPALKYQSITTPEGYFVIQFDNLGPKEHVTVELLNVNSGHPANLPATLRVRSKLGDAKLASFAPMRLMPLWFNRLALALFLLGLIPIFYLFIIFIRLIAKI